MWNSVVRVDYPARRREFPHEEATRNLKISAFFEYLRIYRKSNRAATKPGEDASRYPQQREYNGYDNRGYGRNQTWNGGSNQYIQDYAYNRGYPQNHWGQREYQYRRPNVVQRRFRLADDEFSRLRVHSCNSRVMFQPFLFDSTGGRTARSVQRARIQPRTSLLKFGVLRR